MESKCKTYEELYQRGLEFAYQLGHTHFLDDIIAKNYVKGYLIGYVEGFLTGYEEGLKREIDGDNPISLNDESCEEAVKSCDLPEV